MSFLALVIVGVVVGSTTVVFGFGGGFVTVPIVTVVDAGLGGDAVRVATATSALVMLVNAGVATASTNRSTLRTLRSRKGLFVCLAAGSAVGASIARFAPDDLLRWGFVVYVGITVADLLLRPGFFRQDAPGDDDRSTGGRTIRTGLGLPIGAIAACLGVGGSVMTVPIMRRSGVPLSVAAALANPLTLAIAAPAAGVTLAIAGNVPQAFGLVGSVDVRAAAGLLIGAIPTIVILRRCAPTIPILIHSWGYLILLGVAATVVAIH